MAEERRMITDDEAEVVCRGIEAIWENGNF
jgi:hypothetical protein